MSFSSLPRFSLLAPHSIMSDDPPFPHGNTTTIIDAAAPAAVAATPSPPPSAPRPRPSRTWTAEEDSIVMRTVLAEPADAAPYTRWSELITHLPGRTGKQARGRWTNILNPAIDRTPFGREDDLALLKGHSILGMRWVEISELVFQSRRSENQVKNRVRDGICLFTF